MAWNPQIAATVVCRGRAGRIDRQGIPCQSSLFTKTGTVSPLAIYSSRSGYGKTTVAAIGFNAMCRNVKQRSSDSTLRGFKKMLSVYGSLPVFYDELKDKINAAEAKDLLYNWSNGQNAAVLTRTAHCTENRGTTWVS